MTVIGKIDHVGIAVKNIEEAARLYTDILGLKVDAVETLEERQVKTAVINIGESKIELLESTTPDGVIAVFIEKRGEGMHHVALGVDDIEQTLKDLKAKNLALVDEKPRRGIQNTQTVFVHPKGAKILLELVEN
jgi:methylmalonyl-CoA/ethylmalonyl-CoA epimerase